ncbi:hypothetical protein AB6A40_009490 [Gnathostoma spinigerum]|uniref:GHMP kinase C-terminal domain-containing protein n=1 Tax=Gnathostoma spinigerum TaxID=75299 RepID=A0ABD6EZ70_9BILA
MIMINVLHVEQLLTTGGGWQDQVGGLFPGVKISRFNTENGQLLTEPIPIDGKFVNELEHRLVLVYTGKTRLAKNLLQEVVRNWFSRNSLLLSSLSSLAELSESSASKLANGEFPVEEVKSYYEIKKCIATGCEPLNVKEFKNYLEAEKIIESAWIAGAGGGGFLYLWLTSAGDVQRVLNVINNHSKFAGFTLHSVNIDMNPLHIEAIS